MDWKLVIIVGSGILAIWHMNRKPKCPKCNHRSHVHPVSEEPSLTGYDWLYHEWHCYFCDKLF